MDIQDLESALLFFYKNRDDYKQYINVKDNFKDSLLTKIEVGLIIQKLVKDGYILEETHEVTHFNQQHVYTHSTKDYGYFITYDGILFVEAPTEEYKNRPYQYFINNQKIKDRAERIEKWPKRYWYIIAITSFIIGGFADIVKEAIRRKILPESTLSIPPIPSGSDTSTRH